ncbi:MAG: MmcQ/YjbR family DNA-binding protein [Bacteroidota bacterium]
MVDINTFRELALSLPGTEEKPHFDRAAFKVINKRIFATLHEATLMANMVFSKADQRLYCSFDKKAVYPVPNKWGDQGWTTFELNKLPVELISDALLAAYQGVFKKKTAKK